MLNKKMLDLLVCPLCKGPLVYEGVENELICHIDKLAFSLKGEIPVIIKDEARSFREGKL